MSASIKTIPDFTATTAFNGWQIVPLPVSPGFRTVQFSMNDSVGETKSSFTQQGQFQDWPGADWWDVEVSLPKLSRPQANQWIAFLLSLRGKLNCFSLGDPFQKSPLGSPLNSQPVVDGTNASANAPMSTTLVTRGWAPNMSRLLLPGDHIQIGYRLHVVLNTITASSSGAATLQLWPSIRETPADGTPVVLNAPKGLFRLAENKRTYSVDESRLFGISLKLTEAR